MRGFRPKTRLERIIPLKDGRFVGITSHADPKDNSIVAVSLPAHLPAGKYKV